MEMHTVERDSDGQWYAVWITDLSTNEQTLVGSLKFPFVNDNAAIDYRVYSTLEIYGNPIRPIDIPEWEVTVQPPLGNGERPRWVSYGYAPQRGKILNSNITYSTKDGSILFRVGGTTEPVNPRSMGRVEVPTLTE